VITRTRSDKSRWPITTVDRSTISGGLIADQLIPQMIEAIEEKTYNDARLIGDMMARPARLPGGRFKPDSVREKIRAAQLINRLQAHIFDGLELSMSQVRAIEILLRKSVPDLTKTEVQAEATHRYVAQLPEVLSREEWLAKYGEGQTTLQ
jgi:hypothetical protein